MTLDLSRVYRFHVWKWQKSITGLQKVIPCLFTELGYGPSIF